MPPALPWGEAEPEVVQALAEPPLPINIDQLARKYLVKRMQPGCVRTPSVWD